MKSLVVFQLAGKLLDHRQKNHLDRLHATWINSGNEPNKWEFRFLVTSLFASARWAQDWSNVLPHQSNKMFSTYGILIPSNKLGTKTPTNTHKRKINAKKNMFAQKHLLQLQNDRATWSPATADAKRSPATAKRATWSWELELLVYDW